jgi:DNA-binding beta-propeller fold protein YncE
MNLDGSGLEAIVSGITDPYGIALDPTGGKIYWTDDAGNISRANLDGSSPQIGIVNIAGGQMRAISLDPANNKMYFYEVNLENLFVADLDGSNASVLIPGVYGYSILVDTVNDKIYFDDQNANGGVGTLAWANLDGSGRVNIYDVGSRIYGMAIDYTDNKLYWSGRESNDINKANLDGSNPELVKGGLSSPRGIILKL